MKQVLSIATAKAHFADSVRRAEAGETVVLTRHGRPVAQLGPVEPLTPKSSGEVREPEPAYEVDRLDRPALSATERRAAILRTLEESIWPQVPKDRLGTGVDKREREEILGYGSDGV